MILKFTRQLWLTISFTLNQIANLLSLVILSYYHFHHYLVLNPVKFVSDRELFLATIHQLLYLYLSIAFPESPGLLVLRKMEVLPSAVSHDTDKPENFTFLDCV